MFGFNGPVKVKDGRAFVSVWAEPESFSYEAYVSGETEVHIEALALEALMVKLTKVIGKTAAVLVMRKFTVGMAAGLRAMVISRKNFTQKVLRPALQELRVAKEAAKPKKEKSV